MKKLFLFTIFLLAPLTVAAQCSGDSVCVKQSTVDAATKMATELIEARDVLAKFAVERAATQAERAASAKLIDGLNILIATKDRIELEQNKIIDMYKSVVQMQADIIERLSKQLNAGKSGWQKFVGVLGKVVVLLAGVALGAL